MEGIQQIVLAMLASNTVTVSMVQTVFTGTACCLLGLLSYIATTLINTDVTMNWRTVLAITILSPTLGYALASVAEAYIGWSSYVLVQFVLVSNIGHVTNFTPLELWKILVNSWVALTKREKLTDDDLTLHENSDR